MRNGNGTEKSEVLILLDSRFWGLISIPVMRQGCNRGPPHRRTSGLHLPSWDDNLLPRQKHKKKQVLKTFRRCKSANVIVYLTSPIVDDKIATICALRTLSKNPVCNCWWYKVNTMSLRMAWMLHQMMRKKNMAYSTTSGASFKHHANGRFQLFEANNSSKIKKIRRSDSIDDNCMCWTPGAYNQVNYI